MYYNLQNKYGIPSISSDKYKSTKIFSTWGYLKMIKQLIFSRLPICKWKSLAILQKNTKPQEINHKKKSFSATFLISCFFFQKSSAKTINSSIFAFEVQSSNRLNVIIRHYNLNILLFY